jgi:hypothetical protein
MFIILTFIIHTAFSSPEHNDESKVLRSNQSLLDAYLEDLESSPVSIGTWEILHSNLSTTFRGRSNLPSILISDSNLTPSVKQDLQPNVTYIFTNYIPQTHISLANITKNRIVTLGQIPQEVLENCETPLRKGRLYTTGEYVVTKKFAECMGSTQVYLNRVNRIDFSLKKGNFDSLHTLTVDDKLDAASIQHILPYSQHLTVLGDRIPKWLLNNIETLNAYSLNLPEVSKASTSDFKQLSKFKGKILKLNRLKRLSKKGATALSAFPNNPIPNSFPPNTIELKQLTELTPEAFTQLATGNARLDIQIPNFQSEYFSGPIRNTIFMYGVHEITTEQAQALQPFQGELFFPDLTDISPEAYMHLLWGSKEEIEQTNIPKHKTKGRRIHLPYEQLTMTVEWVQTKLFLEQHYWQTDAHERNRRLRSWVQQFGQITPSAMALLSQNIGYNNKAFHQFDGLSQITPELTRIILAQPGQSSNAPLQFNGLNAIDDESFALIVNSLEIGTQLNGLATFTPSHIQILQNRTSTMPIQTDGIHYLNSEDWTKLAPLNHIKFPDWLSQTPTYLEHHFNRNPQGNIILDLGKVSLSLFQQIDFSDVPRMYLQHLPSLTVKHIDHLKQFEFENLTIPGHLLTKDTIESLQHWPHRETVVEIDVMDTPLENLLGIEKIPVQRIELDNIMALNPDLTFLFLGNIPNVEVESNLPIQGVELFTGESLTLGPIRSSRRRPVHHSSYESDEANSVITHFQGNNLTIDSISGLTPELAHSIMTRTYNLRIQTESLGEDEETVLSILEDANLRNRSYTLHIEDLSDICWHNIEHINESEICQVEREQQEANEYFENHDCGEHDSGEH